MQGRSSGVSDELYNGPTLLGPDTTTPPDRLARLLLWPLLVLLLAATAIFYLLFVPSHVVGDSMEPSLANGDRLLVSRSYSNPHAGDVVIIDGRENSDEDVVKRIVAVAGDRVEIRDDVALVNGRVQESAHILRNEDRGVYMDELVVPDGYVYVLGDNRPVSLDSRFLGPVPLDRIRGRARFVFLPLHRAGAIR
jgi:signal peptidase I